MAKKKFNKNQKNAMLDRTIKHHEKMIQHIYDEHHAPAYGDPVAHNIGIARAMMDFALWYARQAQKREEDNIKKLKLAGKEMQKKPLTPEEFYRTLKEQQPAIRKALRELWTEEEAMEVIEKGVCRCECHKKGVRSMHIQECCNNTYAKYIEENGEIDTNALRKVYQDEEDIIGQKPLKEE